MNVQSTLDRKSASQTFELIPSLDLLSSEVVRLTRGDFATAQSYGSIDQVLDRWNIPTNSRLHLVDLEGSRSGRIVEADAIQRLAKRGFRLQLGGGVRTIDDAQRAIDLGASSIVIGTLLAESPELFAKIVEAVGAERVIAAIDVRDGIVRVKGWEREATRSLDQIFGILEDLRIAEALVTDINVDGTMHGPALDLYRELLQRTSVKILASGGVGQASDLTALAGISGVSGAIVGRALHENRFTLREARTRIESRIPRRIIPCLDVRDGRVVKGVRFEGLRDAGDPVECALRYEEEGADELVMLDVSATLDERRASLETIRKISANLFIPLTVGGGVRSIDDFRTLLQYGADRVALNSAAVENPQLIADCAREFGVQAVVIAIDVILSKRLHRDAKDLLATNEQKAANRVTSNDPLKMVLRSQEALPQDDRFTVTTRSGSSETSLDAISWAVRAEELGAGEILLTSIDRDGTQEGFDLDLLRAVTSKLKIGVIASGGAGKLEHFAAAMERGGASAVLAASLFHDRKLTVGEVKTFLAQRNIDVRHTLEIA